MKNPHGNYWVPDEGYKYITNGDVYTDSIYLGARDSINNWHDTNDEPSEPEDEPTVEEAITRYANELTGQNDPDLVSAAETLIKQRLED